jgi:hypothetical protein
LVAVAVEELIVVRTERIIEPVIVRLFEIEVQVSRFVVDLKLIAFARCPPTDNKQWFKALIITTKLS